MNKQNSNKEKRGGRFKKAVAAALALVTAISIVPASNLVMTAKAASVKTGDVLDFPYTGAVQTQELPAGTYKLEVWGAQGGYDSSSSYGGKGGYSYGTLTLSKKTTLYIYAGGSGNTGGVNGGFNGGGMRPSKQFNSDNYVLNGGGGASDIRIGEDSLYARVIVAGGGGSQGGGSKTGGYAGGTEGQTASSGCGTYGYGGTQTGNLGGNDYYATTKPTSTTATTTYSQNDPATHSGFGFGGNGVANTKGTSYGYGGAGGGGWYGGTGVNPDYSGHDDKGGGGGSGYVYTSATASNYPSGCLLDESMYLTDASTTAGNVTNGIPKTNGSGTETGHTGDGYVRITVVKVKKTVNKDSSGTYIIENEPLYSITFTKRSSYDDSILGGAEFSLTGTSDKGTKVDMTATSRDTNATGNVTFEGLEAGTYVLTETKAPTVKKDGDTTDTYNPDTEKHVVKIEEDGTYTISGLSKDKSGTYNLYNTLVNDKAVVVKKIWKDGITDHKPNELAMTITTEVPKASQRTFKILFDAGDGYFSKDGDNKVTTNELYYNAINEVTDKNKQYAEPEANDSEYWFECWVDKKGNTVTASDLASSVGNTYLNSIADGGVLELTASYVTSTVVYYAVSPYGIGVDTVENDKTAGITFGPATGNMFSSYTNNTYVSDKFLPMMNAHAIEKNNEYATGDTYLINDSSVDSNGQTTATLEWVKADMAAVQPESGTDWATNTKWKNVAVDASGESYGYVKTKDDGTAEHSDKEQTGYNAYRCIHYDNWATIKYWNNENPHVYDKCVENHCSKKLKLVIKDQGTNVGDFVATKQPTNKNGISTQSVPYNTSGSTSTVSNYNVDPNGNIIGDGASHIGFAAWNDAYSNYDPNNYGIYDMDEYSASTIRAKLIGQKAANDSLSDPKTTIGKRVKEGVTTTTKDGFTDTSNTKYHQNNGYGTYTQTIPSSEKDAVVGAFERALGAGSIAAKKMYDTYDGSVHKSNLTSGQAYYDKLWLFDYNEMKTSLNGAGSGRYKNRNAYSDGARGSLWWSWLRSRSYYYYAWYVNYGGGLNNYYVYSGSGAVAPGFVLAQGQ